MQHLNELSTLPTINETYGRTVNVPNLQSIILSIRKWNYLFAKRMFDIICSILAIAFLSPVLATVALLIKAEDGGPVIHTRVCIGKNNKTYKMYKFRSMCVDADNLSKWLDSEQIEEYKKEIKLKNDPRITKIGKFIRKTSIDELAQLYSILRGSMSFVGPRPMVDDEVQYFGMNSDEILSVKPGLTGYWQVNGRSNCTYESGERQKMELFYAHNCGILLDFKILVETVVVVLRREGVY